MAYSLPEIEKDALRLSPEDRARLAVRLLSSLERTAESPEEMKSSGLPRRSGASRSYATAWYREYPLRMFSRSCGISRREADHLPPGSSGGDARSSRVL
jgi:hypothetical protein